MKILPLKNVTDNPSFDVGELMISQLPKYDFDIDSWVIGDRFMEFCVVLIKLCIQNLVIQEILINISREEKPSLPFTFNRVVRDYIRYNTERPILPSPGVLEYDIMESVIQFPGHSVEFYVDMLFDSLLGRGQTYVNTGKMIITRIIEINKKHYWQHEHKKTWISNRILLEIAPNTEASMNAALKKVQEAITEQTIHNEEFDQFSQRLAKCIDRCLVRRNDFT